MASLIRLGRRPCLDGLRGFAAMLVVLTHLHVLLGGVIGVEIFFVLSGFLTTVLLLEEREKTGTISLGSFFYRRVRRILPPLFVVIAVVSLIGIVAGRPGGEVVREAAAAEFFVGNLGLTGMPYLGHTWTLAFEMQFYLIWPTMLALMLAAGVSRRTIVVVLLTGIVASIAWRLAMFTQRPPSGPERGVFYMRLFMNIDTHADTILIGCLAGALFSWGKLPAGNRLFWTGTLCFAGILAVVKFCHQEQQIYYLGLCTVMGLIATGTVVWMIQSPESYLSRVFETPFLVQLGKMSYCLYLVHMPIVIWLPPYTMGAVLTAFGLSGLATVALYHFCERPLMASPRAVPTPAMPVRRAA